MSGKPVFDKATRSELDIELLFCVIIRRVGLVEALEVFYHYVELREELSSKAAPAKALKGIMAADRLLQELEDLSKRFKENDEQN